MVKFQLRRSALRLLSNPSNLACRTRTFTSFAPAPLRTQKAITSIQFQRRWATTDTEGETKEGQVPVSEIQATPQEEVENAIISDNANDGQDASAEPTSQEEPSMMDKARNAMSSATSAVADTVGLSGSTGDSSSSSNEDGGPQLSFSNRDPNRDANRDQMIGTPKPTIYIGNLFFDVTESDLMKELSRFGKIVKCRLIRDSRGLSKGFGYVDFETTESASQAIATLNQQLFEGRRLAVQFAAYESKTIEQKKQVQRGPVNPPSKTLFIGNMSFEMTDRDLNNLFRGIRNVIDVRVAIDRRTGQPRGFAHADFTDVKSAMEAMKVLAEKETYGRKLRLDYSYGPSNAPRNQANRDMPSGQQQGEAPTNVFSSTTQ